MAKRIKEYLAYVDKLLARDDVDFDEEMRRHLVQIKFFMHERLIHLLVTILFAILTVGCSVAACAGCGCGNRHDRDRNNLSGKRLCRNLKSSDDLFWMLYDCIRYRGDHPVKSYPQTRTAEKRP